MSNKPKGYRKRAAAIQPKFVLAARPIARKYQVVIWYEDGEYYGRGVELPYAFGDGKTAEACMKNTREAFVTAIAGCLQDGKTPPAAATSA